MNRFVILGAAVLISACASDREVYVLEGYTELAIPVQEGRAQGEAHLSYDPENLPDVVVSDALRLVVDATSELRFPGTPRDQLRGFANQPNQLNRLGVFTDCGGLLCTTVIPFEIEVFDDSDTVWLHGDAILTTDSMRQVGWAEVIQGELYAEPRPVAITLHPIE